MFVLKKIMSLTDFRDWREKQVIQAQTTNH